MLQLRFLPVPIYDYPNGFSVALLSFNFQGYRRYGSAIITYLHMSFLYYVCCRHLALVMQPYSCRHNIVT